MSNLHLVTGYAGEAHITSADQGSFNAALMGNGEFVLERGNQFAASIITNNQVRVLDGDLLMQGRHIRMKENTFADLYFDNGTQGYKRIDLIVARYTKDATTDIESAELVVIKGTPSESDAVAPVHVTGDIINEQALQNDVVLYQVPFDGINMQELVKVFSTVETLETLKKQLISDVEEKLKDVEIPIISDIEEMKLIEKYGEYVADAKTVGEVASAFQDGCDTIVSGCTTYGSTPSSNSPDDIVTAIKDIYTDRYNTGYNKGRDSSVLYLGTGNSFNVSSIAGYEKLTVDNFFVVYKGMSLTLNVDGNGSTAEGDGSASISLSKSYNSSTGQFVITSGIDLNRSIEYYGAEAWTSVSADVEVYLVLGKITAAF